MEVGFSEGEDTSVVGYVDFLGPEIVGRVWGKCLVFLEG